MEYFNVELIDEYGKRVRFILTCENERQARNLVEEAYPFTKSFNLYELWCR